ncbi:MAG: flap endonuclease-1 [Candidatus Woesearchaeota archaeon]
MGSKITDLLEGKEIKVESLAGKVLAVDAFNTLYMFLTTIRGPDGSPLMTREGKITSHIQGLISRFTNYSEKGLKFVFVFDGTPPKLKSEESKRRKSLKEEAKKLYKEAKDKDDVENMKKYAARSVFLTDEMIEETKELLKIMGIPVVQAPSEGEAQAAHLVKKGDAYAVVSQDADSLLNGALRVIKNMSITGRRKLPGNLGYKTLEPELIELKPNLEKLALTQDELIMLAILIGTDYNYGGVKGIGPKKGIKLVKKEKEKSFETINWEEHFDIEWKDIFDTIKDMPITDDYELRWQNPDYDKLREFLEKRDFSENRIDSTLRKIKYAEDKNKQKGLSEFF